MIFEALHGERIEIGPGAADGAKVAIYDGFEATIQRKDFPALAALFGESMFGRLIRLDHLGEVLASLGHEEDGDEDWVDVACRIARELDARIAKEQGE